MRAGLYGRVSTPEQSLAMQMDEMERYALARGWSIEIRTEEVASGAKKRPLREAMLKMARQRKLDAIIVWRLDRWGRSGVDLMSSLKELTELGVAFVSLKEALDLTTSTGRAMAGFFSIFAEFERDLIRERVVAGIQQARREGKPHGRPQTAATRANEVRELRAQKLSKSEIARKLGISRTSVGRILKA